MEKHEPTEGPVGQAEIDELFNDAHQAYVNDDCQKATVLAALTSAAALSAIARLLVEIADGIEAPE